MSRSRDKAIRDLRAAEAQLAHWESLEVTKSAEAASLRSRAGDEVLTAPDRAADVASALAAADAAADIARQAVAAARPKVAAAERVVWDVEASDLERQAKAAQAKLDAHNAKTAGLLTQLSEHEGEYMPVKVALSLGAAHPGLALEQPQPLKSWPLSDEVNRLTLRAQLLRDKLAGIDPQIRLNEISSKDIVDAQVYGLPKSAYEVRTAAELVEA